MVNKNQVLHQNCEISEIENLRGFKRISLVGLVFLFVEIVFLQALFPQIIPAEGDTLAYRHIRFEWEPVWNAKAYQLRIWESDPETLDSPLSASHHQVIETSFASAIVTSGLEFGKSYAWQVKPLFVSRTGIALPVQHFHIRQAPRIDPEMYRHRVVVDALPRDSYYFFIDKPGVLIDQSGAPVWYVPADSITRVFNLQLLANGNIAYLRPTGGKSGNEGLSLEEITLDGTLVWRAPDDGQVSGHDREYYHHDFQRLKNGNYMVIGDHYLDCQPAAANMPIIARYGTLIEYNPAGEVVWYWRSEDYLQDIDVFADGLKDNPTHMNGFFMDESKQEVFISFRYIDRVVQLSYPEKTVIQSFGRKMPSGEANSGEGAFVHQHSPNISGDSLFLYDNRKGRGADSVSSIVILSVPDSTGTPTQVLARYPLNFGSRYQSWSESKGDVDLMPGKRMLACMGAVPRSLVWQIGAGIVWQVEHETRREPGGVWQGIAANYRAHWTSSLYPLSFAVSIGPAPQSGKRKAAKIGIENQGNISDTYSLWILDKKGRKRGITRASLVPGERFEFMLPLKKGRQATPVSWKILIQSEQNPNYSKNLTIPVH